MAPAQDRAKMTKSAKKKAADLLKAKATSEEKGKKKDKVICAQNSNDCDQ